MNQLSVHLTRLHNEPLLRGHHVCILFIGILSHECQTCLAIFEDLHLVQGERESCRTACPAVMLKLSKKLLHDMIDTQQQKPDLPSYASMEA